MRTFTFITLFNNYGDFIERILGLDEHQLEEGYGQYTIQQPLGSVNDYMWSLFNRMLLKVGLDYHEQSQIYHSMAVFVAVYEGKNGNQYKRLSLNAEIEEAKNKAGSIIKQGVVIIADIDCSNAMKYDGVVYPIDELPDELPLANEDCEQMFCRCTTSAVPIRDENGHLIWL